MKINNILVISLPNVDGYSKKIAVEQLCKCSVGFVKVKNKQDLLDVLFDNSFNADLLIIDGHGEEGKFITSYYWDEYLGANELLLNFKHTNSIILSCACETGTEELAKVFCKNNKAYIAPEKEIDHTSDYAFVTRFVYELGNNDKDLQTSFRLANCIDDETQIYKLWC